MEEFYKRTVRDVVKDIMPSIVKGYKNADADGGNTKEKAYEKLKTVFEIAEEAIPAEADDRGGLLSELNKAYKNHQGLIEKAEKKKSSASAE